jgi:ATPase subunit of ABC transporter with duplicated ATPase domains
MKTAKISLDRISLSFEKKVLFDDLEFSLIRGDKVTIVGENGIGKTTFLRLLSGVEYVYSGTMSAEGRIGFLPQHFEDIAGDDPALITLLKSLDNPEIKRLLDPQNYKPLSPEWYTELNMLDGYEIFRQANLIGLSSDLLEQPFKLLSGGEKTKTMLCALRNLDPDFILLDEPTNHLDDQGIKWLEEFLKDFDGGIVMVTHDRTLINAVSNQICELSPHTKQFVKFKGGYDNYLKEEEKKRQLSIQERHLQEKELKSIQQKHVHLKGRTMDRKIRDLSTGGDQDKLSYNHHEQRVQHGRTKALNQFTRMSDQITEDLVEIVPERPRITFEFDQDRDMSSVFIEVHNVTKSFKETLFRDVSFTLRGGARMIIQGPNGSGKSTLMKIMMNLMESDQGNVSFSSGAIVGYLDQEQENLPLDKTPVELLMEDPLIQASKETAITNLCHFGIFAWNDISGPMKTLSIGCRRKAQLCQIMMRKSTILILDEPTNHIDFPSLEVIEEALLRFPGIKRWQPRLSI